MRKVDDGEKKKRKKEKKIWFIVATNIVARLPPECQLTGTPPARANFVNTGLIF